MSDLPYGNRINADCGQCGVRSLVTCTYTFGYDHMGNALCNTRWDCPSCQCDNEIIEQVKLLVKAHEPICQPSKTISITTTMTNKKNRSCTIAAAAFSLGVSEDILDAVLPTLRELTENAKRLAASESKPEGCTDVRIEFPQPIIRYEVNAKTYGE